MKPYGLVPVVASVAGLHLPSDALTEADYVVVPSSPAPLRVVDSITELGPSDAGCIAVSGSHGGTSSGRFAIATRPALTVFNDAGVGKNGAGLAALALLQEEGLAACTVCYTSARIGDAASSLHDGTISHCNALAQQAGVAGGQSCQQAIQHFRRHLA